MTNLKPATHSQIKAVLTIALDLLCCLMVVFFMRTYVASAFQVDGGSMCDTLNFSDQQCHMDKGDMLIVDKLGYQNFFGSSLEKIKRGDIIVFHPPGHEDDFYIKRIIGLPGETVTIKNGKVFISNADHPQGFELIEPYLNEENQNHTALMPSQGQGKNIFKVPADHYFVLGDNRRNSSDSRTCFDPLYNASTCDNPQALAHFVDSPHIEGRAWIVFWPLNKLKIFAHP